MSDFNSPPSSALESDQLKLLSEQLCSLNADSAHITTHIHRRQTPLRNRLGLNKRQSLSTPRKCVSILSPAVSEVLRSPRSTPRKSSFKTKTPVKVKFAFPETPSKSQLSSKKLSANKKSSSTAVSPLKFPTPDKKQTKRKLYTESPEEEQEKGKKKVRRWYARIYICYYIVWLSQFCFVSSLSSVHCYSSLIMIHKWNVCFNAAKQWRYITGVCVIQLTKLPNQSKKCFHQS